MFIFIIVERVASKRDGIWMLFAYRLLLLLLLFIVAVCCYPKDFWSAEQKASIKIDIQIKTIQCMRMRMCTAQLLSNYRNGSKTISL